MADETIAILGGTGDLGTGLAIRWSKAGYKIVIGSRTLTTAQAAVAALETGWLEDLWRCLDDGATVLQDDFTERFEGIFQQWSDEVLCPMDIGG